MEIDVFVYELDQEEVFGVIRSCHCAFRSICSNWSCHQRVMGEDEIGSWRMYLCGGGGAWEDGGKCEEEKGERETSFEMRDL